MRASNDPFSPCGRRWPSGARSEEGLVGREWKGWFDPSPDRAGTTAAPPCAVSLSRKGRGAAMIQGYASLWGVADLNGDVVQAGAFADSLAKTGAQGVRMLSQHDARAPVGVWDEIVEDERGLFVRGRIEDWSPEARFAAALSRAGAMDGLSIGYRTARARRQGRLRVLSGVELWEVSLVTFPMLPGARFSLA
jgi:HK97 family phage prohead protease